MEVERLQDASRGGPVAQLSHQCALAVLNSGQQGNDAEALLQRYGNFYVEVQQG